MCYLRRLQLAALSLALITPLGAQQGDRKGHNMASFVPEDVIPPAPFLNVEHSWAEASVPLTVMHLEERWAGGGRGLGA